MQLSMDELTVDDLRESGWREIIANMEEGDCISYTAAFGSKAEEARTEGNEKRAKALELLAHLTSMRVSKDDTADPLKPMFQGPEGRSAMCSDFDPAMELLESFLPHIDDDELAARVADVIWLRKHNFRAARTAALAYINSAGIGERKQWSESTRRMERAVSIAAQANQRDLIEKVIQRVEVALTVFNGTETFFLPLRLMRMLLERKAGDSAKYATLSEIFATAAEGRGDWHQAREYWILVADWFRTAKDEVQEKAARVRSAETYVREAEAQVNDPTGNQSYIAASHLIECAIHAFRKIAEQSTRIADLHRMLLESQENSNAEMKVLSYEYDASKLITAATEKVAGKNVYDALFELAMIGSPPQLENLKRQAELQRQDSILELIGVTRFTNAMGRTVARRDLPDEGEEEQEADLRITMYKAASLSHTILVQSMIIPALTQILREHTIAENDLRVILRDNPLIPNGREEFYVRGLHAGFRQDWTVAMHLLIPQIEHSIRHVLGELGIITSGLDDEGIQDERDLNRTLRLPEFADPLKSVFGEDLIFDLRGLLIERYGSNLRNDLAHGLLDYNSFASFPCVYLWWLTLHILYLPMAKVRYDNNEEAIPSEPEEGADKVGEANEEA